MKRGPTICERLGLPANAKTHPDPTIRKAYHNGVYRAKAAAKLAARNAVRGYCIRRIGQGPCGARLIRSTDQIGRVVVSCPLCTRRNAGLCIKCPRKIVGNIPRGASFCTPCRNHNNRIKSKRSKPRDPVRARRMKRERSARLHRELYARRGSPDPVIAAEAAAKIAAINARRRKAYLRRCDAARESALQ